jgi:glycosyltransferase involved in cell wall biosynthesis
LSADAVPLVSVIVPCYRQARYLPEALDSALGQSHAAVEVLVVNDGSDDDTEAVARSYGDRIRYLWRPNGGLSAARNSGIREARGRYLKFLDADDALHPDQIAWQVEAVQGRDDCVSLTAVRLYRDGHPEQFIDHVPQAKALLPDLFQDIDWGGIHGFLFPTALVRAVGGFDESLRFAEDWNFFCRVGLHDPVLTTDARVGAYYRLRAGSMSTNRPGMAATRGRLLCDLHDILRAKGRRDWFGLDLLKVEQATYQGLVQMGVRQPELLDGLLRRLRELQAVEGFGLYGWRFRLLARLLGYARAERLRGFLVRALRKRPPESLDIAAWREGP